MRKAIIAGNWKMNKTPAEAAELVKALAPAVKDAACDVVVCVPAVDFAAVKEAAAGTNIRLGAQKPTPGRGSRPRSGSAVRCMPGRFIAR